MRRRAVLPLLLAAAATLACLAAAEAPLSDDGRTAYLGTVPVRNSDEAAVAAQLIRGFESVADEILTGRENPIVFSAAAPIDDTTAVNVSEVQAKVRWHWAEQGMLDEQAAATLMQDCELAQLI